MYGGLSEWWGREWHTVTAFLAIALLILGALVVGASGAAAGAQSSSDAGAALRTASSVDAAPTSHASLQQPDFSTSTFLSGVNQPMGMTWLPDGRMLIIEKPGTIEITDPDDGTKDTSTYMDITGQVNDGRERGLIDITLDPNFDQNGYVYVFYSNDAESTNRIARFTHQENGGGLQSTADPGSEFVVWKEDEQWQSCCHQGAGLDFGPDGKLWLTTGDDFEGGAVSQNLAKASGKVIRVNKDGTIPQDNPYVDDGDSSTLGEIWAYGVRNPFRAEWDLQSGRFFFGDVGGNSAPDYEEVNVATLNNPGANYGWPDCEGTSKSNEDAPCDVSQTAPVYSYPHSEGNSITGGEVYRGQQFPDEYQGAYFFGDYAQDWIKYLTFDSNGDAQSVQTFEDNANNVNAIAVGPDGALYWTSISDGEIHKISYTGNQAPSIDSVSATPTSAASAPVTVDFSVSASDPEQDPLTYSWTFGDGSTGTGASPSHTYQTAGVYTAYVEVSDGTQTIESQPIEITIGEPPTVTIDSPQDGSLFQAGDTISFSASGSDPQDGTLASDAFTWDVVFDHNPPEGASHTHPVLTDYSGATGSFDVPTSGHGYSTDTSYTLTVTATDSDGLSASQSVTIEPDKVDVTFATNPSGLDLSVDGVPVSAGTTLDTLVGFEHTVDAPGPQCLNGREYEFQSWSDGGAQTHTYTVPTADATLTATYQDIGECSAPVTDGLVAQFEADQGLSTSGGQVTAWADQSGQGNDLTAVGDPTTTTAPSGQPAVSFDGSDDKLERTATLSNLPSGNDDRTVVLVGKYDSTGYGGFTFGDDDTNQAFGTVVDPSGELMVQAWGSSNDYSSGTAGTGAGWLIQSATLDSSSLTHYKDGQVIDTRTHTYATDLQQLVMGAEIDSNPYLEMDVAAAYVYDRALTDTERQQVESHLRDKYLDTSTSNQNPTASDDSATVDAGQSVTIDVLANDADPDGTLDTSTVTIDQAPDHGTATVNADGSITYTHDGSDTTGDSFVYQVSDDQGAGDAATVSITIDQGAGSTLPVTSGLVTHYAADQGISTSTGDVVTGWADQSGQGNDLTATGDPLVKHDTLNGNQVLSFDGDGDALLRTDTLNGLPSGSADRTVMYVVNYQSSPSFGGGVTYGATSCSQTFGPIVHESNLMVQGWCDDFGSGVSADVGPGGWMSHSATLESDQVTHYKNGTQIDQYIHTYDTNLQKLVIGAELDENPYVDMEVAEVVVYDRALSDSERQQVESYFDSTYFSETTTNQPPTASDDSASVTAGQSTTIDVLANDADSDGTLDVSSVQVTSGPSTGSTSVDSTTGEITYSAPSGASGDVTFTYSVADDDGATDTATVTVSISQPTDSPLPVTSGLVTHLEADQGVTTSNGYVTAWADQSGQGNDLSAAGDPTPSTAPSGQPAVSFDGTSDKLERTATLNGLPSGNGDRSVFLVANYSSTGYGGFAFGDHASNEAFGTVVDPAGDLMVQGWGPSNDYSSGTAGTGEGWLVQSATLDGGSLSHYKDGQVIDTQTHSYNTDLQQMVLGAELDSNPYLDMDVGAVYVYDRALSDSERQQVEQYLIQKYISANSPPTASDDSASVTAGQSTTIDVLANDADADGTLDPSSVQVTSVPSTGSTSVDASTGAITYTAPTGASGDVTFTYSVADDDGATDTATVTVTISPADTTYGVVTGSTTNVQIDTSTLTNASADMSGTLTLGDKSEATPYVKIWPEEQPQDAFWYTGSPMTASGEFAFDVVLSPSTTYVWQTYAQSGDGEWKAGGEKTFTTPTGQYFGVTTNSPSSVGVEWVTLEGEIVNLGDNTDATTYFTYWKQGQKSSTLTWYTGPVQSSTGPFSTQVQLDPGTTYEYRAFGQSNEGEWKAGPVTTFTTQAGEAYGVETDPATNVGANSATLNGDLTGLGDYDSATPYFQYWVQGQKGSTLNWWTGAPRTTPGTFDVSVSGLTAETTYVVQAYAQSNEGKWTAGSQQTLTTDAAGANTPPTAADDSASVTAGQSTTIDVLANDADADGTLDASSVSIASAPSTGTATANPDGTITYAAPSGASGDVTFTYSVADDDGATDSATVTVTVSQPATLPVTNGLVTHLEADTGVATTNGQVTGWTDQSSVGIDLSAAGNPQLQSNALNGHPVISLDGGSDGAGDKLVRTADLTGLPSGAQDRSMFLVAKYESTDAYVGAAFGNGEGNQAFGTVVEDGGDLTVQGWGNANDLVSDTAGVGAGWLVQSATVAGNQVTHYKDGSQIDSGTQAYDTTLDATSSKFVIGEEIDQIGYADMEIAGVVVYDRALSETERQQVESYFQQKYFAANQAPTASDDSATVTAGQSTTIDVLANDADADGTIDPASVQVTSGPSTGSTSVDSSTGAITYTAPSGASGDVTFTYSVADDDGATDTATVTVTVEAANQPPTASDDSASVTAGQSTVIDVLANDADADGTLDPSSVQVSSAPATGSTSVDTTTGEITYSAPSGTSGDVTFTYSVADDDGATDTATVTVTVTSANQAPTASDDSAAVTAGESTSIDVLANDGDSDGSLDASTVTISSAPSTGTATANPDGTITYSAPAGASGDVTFTYTVADDDGATSNEATVTVAVNQPPSAAFTPPTDPVAGSAVTFDASGSGDADGSIATYEWDFDGDGTVEASTGSASVTHTYAASGTYTVELTVTDDDGATDSTSQSVSVAAPNQAPTASDDSASVSAGQSTTIDVLANDGDADGTLDPSSVQVTSAPASGSTSVDSSTGAITYTHGGDGATSDSFTYSVADDDGAVDTATVSITIDQQALPVTNGLVSHFVASEGVSTSNGAVTSWADQSAQGNDLTASGDPTVVSNALGGEPVVSFDGTGDLLENTAPSGLPSGNADRTVMYVVNYQSSPDFGGGLAHGTAACSKTFGLIVHNGNLWVQGWCDDFGSGTSADVGPGGWMTQSAVLASDQVTHFKNATQIDQYTHTYNTDPQKLVIGAEIDGSPGVDMEVAEAVIYDRALTDSERESVESHLHTKYFGTDPTVNQPPSASDDSASVTAGQSTTIDVLANDADPDGSLDPSSVQVTTAPSTGTTSVDSSTGEITYAAPSGTSGDVTFTYSVADDDGATDTATVTVTVSAANQAPTASDDSASVSAGNSVTVDVLANDADTDGTLDPASVQVTSAPSSGTTAVDSSTGAITYTHDGSGSTADSFTYSVADDDGATDTATVSVSISQPSSSLPVTSGLVTHLAADQGVSTSGNTVTDWTDQSGTGIDLAASGDPQLQSSVLNGQPVISLDGADDKLVRTSDLTGLPSGAQDRSMFVVTKYDNANDWAGTAFGNGDSNQAFGLVVKGGSGELTVQGWGNDLVSGTQGSGAGWMTQSAVVASDQVTHYQNGTQIDSGSKTYDTTLDAASSKFVIGEEIAENGFNDMDVAVVVVYDRALSETERQQVESHLQSKYFGGSTNEAPTASDDSASVTAGQSTTIDVLANDADADGSLDASSVQVTSGPSTGTTSVDASTGEITYSAPSGASGDVTFTYTVADDDGATSNEATVTVSVTQPSTSIPVTSGLVAHFEADQGVTTSGGQVTAWADQSGQGNDLTAFGDPVTATAPSGQPALSLDGTDDNLSRLGALSGLPSADQDRTVVVATKYDGASAYAGTAFGDGATNEAFGLVVNGGNGQLTVQGYGGSYDMVSGTQGTGAGWLVQSAVVASDQVTHYKDGTQIDSATRTYATDLQKFAIGEELAGAGHADMEIAAVAVYDRALSDSEREQVETYLADGYLSSGGS